MNAKTWLALLMIAAGLAGCEKRDASADKTSHQTPKPTPQQKTLAEARQGFTTHLLRRESAHQPLDEPPADVFRKVMFDSPVGPLAAYLTPDPGDHQRHPAIIWITGGDYSSIGDVWSPAPTDNEQTASAYRKAGLVMMFPSLRGGNTNPGVHEGFLGEVDDVVAAADFLARQPYVDPDRIYLGGHSSGGTLVLLVAEYSDRFRDTFAFGPVDDPAHYPAKFDFVPYDTSDERERQLRAPIRWLHSIKRPVFVIEGTEGNEAPLCAMRSASTNPQAHFFLLQGVNHFAILDPVNRVIAQALIHDTGPSTNVTLDETVLNRQFAR